MTQSVFDKLSKQLVQWNSEAESLVAMRFFHECQLLSNSWTSASSAARELAC